jgi:hypothetical protein
MGRLAVADGSIGCQNDRWALDTIVLGALAIGVVCSGDRGLILETYPAGDS